MGLLAYDRERVAFLRNQLAAAADELRLLRTDDPAAASAMRTVATIRTDIDVVWLPLLTRILDNTALTRPLWQHAMGGDGLREAVITVMADGYGWSVQVDPLNDNRSVVTAAEARALGALLNTAELPSLIGDRDQLRWLAQQLKLIGRDPALSADFLANFESWPTLTYVLGLEYAMNTRPEIEAMFDGLMSIWTHSLPPTALTAGKSATLDALLPPIDDVDPYVQALMLRSLPTDTMTLATVTDELLTRWLAVKNDPSARVTIDRGIGTGPNAADILLPRLLDDPAACAYFTELASRHPAILFETLNDPGLAYEVVLVGTDPANTTTAAAGDAVLAILDYFRVDPYTRPGFDTDGHPGDYGEFLGALVAPWLLQFTMTNDDWHETPGTKAALLHVALRDEQAMARLIADADRIRAGFGESLSTYDITAAQQVGGLLNLLLQLSVNETVDDEIASTDERINLIWTVIVVASNFLPGGPLVGITSTILIASLSSKLDEYLDQPDPTGVRRTTERAMDVALALAGADAVSNLHQQWVADGKIGASHKTPPAVDVTGEGDWCPSADYHGAFDEWRSGLPGGRDGLLGRQANDLLEAFVGSSEAQANCAEVAG